MSDKRKPWWKNCQWEVIIPVTEGAGHVYKAIYCSRTRPEAVKDAASWRADNKVLGSRTTIVIPGPGHRSRRG